jgi:hypothetical protein
MKDKIIKNIGAGILIFVIALISPFVLLISLFNKNKSIVREKKVSKKDFANWPFKPDKMIITNTMGTMVYCRADKDNYALNGYAQDQLKLPHLFDSDLYVQGVDVGDIISFGLSLFSEKERIQIKAGTFK